MKKSVNFKETYKYTFGMFYKRKLLTINFKEFQLFLQGSDLILTGKRLESNVLRMNKTKCMISSSNALFITSLRGIMITKVYLKKRYFGNIIKNIFFVILLISFIRCDDAQQLNNKGVALRKQGRYTDALAYFKKSIRKNPKIARSWTNKGYTLYKLGMITEALECYDNALKLDFNESQAWLGKANLFENVKDFTKALECYDKAIEVAPRNEIVVMWLSKGNLLIEIKKNDEAIKCYDKVLEIASNGTDVDPNQAYTAAWIGKANAYRNLGETDESNFCYEQARLINPNLP